ncbi:MAG: hypothetical protein QS98_C0008G0011 [archaeon GW2011_AR3]|nr:MAG: hypothetical protein QS98_C0008G0011 [archaeon GW2011_AR3]
MARQKISIAIDIETASKLLARLAKERKNGNSGTLSRSDLVEKAIKENINSLQNESEAGEAA